MISQSVGATLPSDLDRGGRIWRTNLRAYDSVDLVPLVKIAIKRGEITSHLCRLRTSPLHSPFTLSTLLPTLPSSLSYYYHISMLVLYTFCMCVVSPSSVIYGLSQLQYKFSGPTYRNWSLSHSVIQWRTCVQPLARPVNMGVDWTSKIRLCASVGWDSHSTLTEKPAHVRFHSLEMFLKFWVYKSCMFGIIMLQIVKMEHCVHSVKCISCWVKKCV
jgi:hypothetical protein